MARPTPRPTHGSSRCAKAKWSRLPPSSTVSRSMTSGSALPRTLRSRLAPSNLHPCVCPTNGRWVGPLGDRQPPEQRRERRHSMAEDLVGGRPPNASRQVRIVGADGIEPVTSRRPCLWPPRRAQRAPSTSACSSRKKCQRELRDSLHRCGPQGASAGPIQGRPVASPTPPVEAQHHVEVLVAAQDRQAMLQGEGRDPGVVGRNRMSRSLES